MNLSGRVALITGGAGHLGQVFCETLAEMGAEVCVLDICVERAQSLANSLSAQYARQCSAVAADITDEHQVANALHQTISIHRRLDILVNNAAYPPNDLPHDGQSLHDQRFAQWQANLSVMLTGTFLMTRESSPHLAQSGHGVVLNVASIYGLVGPDMSLYHGTDMQNPAYYAAGKGGIVQLTRYLGTTLAPAVRVNCIAPGGIWRNQPKDFVERYCARTPLGRMATEGDIKGALAFLVSDLSEYITGQVVAVDGGWTSW